MRFSKIMRMFKRLSLLGIICCLSLPVQADNHFSKDLGWIKQSNQYNICGGFYKELPIIYIPNPLAASQKTNYDISADQSTYVFKKGVSTLKGNVRITRPQTELTADVAYVYNNKEGQPKTAKGFGHVKLRQPGKLIIAKRAQVDFPSRIITLHNVIYRMALNKTKVFIIKNPKTGKFERRLYQINAWGTADKAKQLKPGLIELRGATYTTCPPDSTCWKVKASTVKLNSKTGRGDALNSRLLIGNVPILYLPYFNFPIDKRRQTGFLLPTFSTSSHNGFTAELPYYLNLAPNYDATITPNIMYKRGVLWDGLFRYLTSNSSGQIGGGYIFSDREFKRFKRHAKTDWAARPTLDTLEQSSNNRRSFTWRNHTQFNDHWKSDVDYNYVSDDYFIQDFGDNMLDNSDNQVLRQGTVNYDGQYWNFLGNLQYYQTLHPVNQADVLNQYARIPQLQLTGDFPNRPLGMEYTLGTEVVRFWKRHEPNDLTNPIIGNRASIRPAVSLPILWPFAYFTPRVQLQMTKYDLGHVPGHREDQPGFAVPMFDLNTGLYFDRNIKLFRHSYRQTLEPQLYYLYVPYRNQNRFPYFDTNPQSFTYDFMFQDNRFSGIDRIGDANQVTTGMTTRFIDNNTGEEKASASIGQIRYFRDRKVSLCANDDTSCTMSSTDQRPVSPIAGQATYHFNPNWSALAGLTWNSHRNGFDNQNVGLQYKPDDYHIVSFNYSYARGGDVLAGLPADSVKNDLKQTDVGAAWRLNNHWSLMGRWNYNWSHEHAQAYFGGVAYESCCWAVRVLAARTFVSTGPAPDYKVTYDNTVYLQFALKGLGNVGSEPNALLSSGISGYEDTFGKDN